LRGLPARARLLIVAVCFAAASAASVAWIDQPLARFIHAHGSGLAAYWQAGTAAFDAVTGIDLWKYFAAAVLVAAGLTASVQPRLRSQARALWFVAATHLACVLSTSLLKSGFGRLRPYVWFERGQPAQLFFSGGGGFPSGHVLFYLSLCLPAALVWPRLRVLLVVPLLLACTRIGAEQHFLGDTLAAAAWVMLLTWAVRARFERFAPQPPASARASDRSGA